MKKLPVALLLGGLLLTGQATADNDPTRPPAAYLGQATAAGAAVEEGGLRLQSVLTPQRGKPLAIIGGTTVGLGGKVGGATLVRLSEREAVLQGPEGVTRLYLTPDVEKQMIVTPAPRSKGKSRQGKDLP